MIECFIDKMLNAPLILTEWQDQLWNMLWYRKRLFPLVVRIVHIQGGNDDHGQDGISILALFFFGRSHPTFFYYPTERPYEPRGRGISLRET